MAVSMDLADLLLEHDKETPKYTLGELRMTAKNGRFMGIYQYVKANETLTRGQILTDVPWATWDTTIVIDGAVVSADKTIHIDTVATAMTANQYKGYWIRQAAAAGPLGGAIQIKSHPAIAAAGEGDLTMERAALEAIADGKALEIHNPYLVEKVDGAAEPILGVAPADFTSGQYGWMQVGGNVPAVLCGHSTSAAIVLDEPMIPIAALAGSAQGYAAGTPNEAEILQGLTTPLRSRSAVGANTVCYIPAYMKFSG